MKPLLFEIRRIYSNKPLYKYVGTRQTQRKGTMIEANSGWWHSELTEVLRVKCPKLQTAIPIAARGQTFIQLQNWSEHNHIQNPPEQ
jgi:hypothetical protein